MTVTQLMHYLASIPEPDQTHVLVNESFNVRMQRSSNALNFTTHEGGPDPQPSLNFKGKKVYESETAQIIAAHDARKAAGDVPQQTGFEG